MCGRVAIAHLYGLIILECKRWMWVVLHEGSRFPFNFV